jgi:extracellular factor (EF) 3-hydroxypalmitic acid methyl ester biosynthesis protein
MIADLYGTIRFKDEAGVELQATPLRVGRHQITFEVVAPDVALRSSQLLGDFRFSLDEATTYAGRATLTSVTQMGTQTVCVATIEEGWGHPGLPSWNIEPEEGSVAFRQYLNYWQKFYRVDPAFKSLLVELQTFLGDLRFWCEPIEDGAKNFTGDRQQSRMRELLHNMGRDSTAMLNEFFERFELLAGKSDEGSRPAYRILARRLLHPLLLCSPFLYRTYRKPLGYAGDYEMVNMISRDPFEGPTFYAKLVNLWFLKQPPAEAHRNRIQFLQEKIDDVVIKAVAEGRRACVYNLGCGPALELQDYLASRAYSDHADFVLVDFNEETLTYAKTKISAIKKSQHRSAEFEFIKKSVNQVLKEASAGIQTSRVDDSRYDLVYCAGLYDYLTDAVCRRLSTQLYRLVRPGGLLLTTNVHSSNPWPMVMDFIMDWHLIYRTADEMLATNPVNASVEDMRVSSDCTGVNIYSEIFKPQMKTP